MPLRGDGPGGGGGDSHTKVTGMLVVSLSRCKLQILVSLRVSRTQSQYFYHTVITWDRFLGGYCTLSWTPLGVK